MTQELWLLLLSVVLGLAHIGLFSAAQKRARGRDWYAGTRDESVAPLTGAAGRLERALKNFGETFPLFAAVVLAAQIADRHGWSTILGAHLYFWGRVAYLPAYAYGAPRMRSAAWVVASFGIALILLGMVAAEIF